VIENNKKYTCKQERCTYIYNKIGPNISFISV